MKRIDLKMVPHSVKIGDKCPEIEPTINTDAIFYDKGEAVGFYMGCLPDKLRSYISIANAELLSDRVPKQLMSRGPQGSRKDKQQRARDGVELVTQYSTILGGVPPKPHMKRNYPTMSSVHQVATARTFIKAMALSCLEAENLLHEVAPNIYLKQKKIVSEKVPPQWRFGNLFTSSISNFNIAAQYHRDRANLSGCVNVIITKRANASGGNTTIPDYGITVDSKNDSILVYPAWRNIHGVTPISLIKPNGYRNTLVFYPLKAFGNYW
jgi:hypothetical protein|tara:strand:+ start:1571 stop:2371 length:801 start_codon:yes stop_codon:yes gene_type:complete